MLSLVLAGVSTGLDVSLTGTSSEPYTLAVDTETTGLDWFDGDWPFIATATDHSGNHLWRLPGERAELREALLGADRLVFHNAKFDVHMLVAAGVVEMAEILGKRIEDTDLLARCVLGCGNGPFGLKHLATIYVDPAAGDAEAAVHEKMVEMGLIKKVGQRASPPGAYYAVWQAHQEVLERYAMEDTAYTYALFYKLMELADADALKVYELEMRLFHTVIRMEHTGIALDRDRVERLHGKYTEIEKRTGEDLEGYWQGEEPLNVNSNRQVAELLADHGVKLTKRTDTGEIRVDKWALEPFEGTQVVDTLQEHRQANKFLSTYIAPMRDRDVIHTSFWQMEARTGRMSSSRPNMQNIPQRSGTEVREIFVPRKGYCFVVADYSSIELRLLAYYMNHTELWEIINSGDPFVWLGTQIYGTDVQNEWPVSRQPLKNAFYAMSYGAGGPKIASTIGGGMTPEEGRELVSSMKGVLGAPYRQLNNNIRSKVAAGKPLKTIGRRAEHVPADKGYIGLNRLIQGSAADIIKEGLVLADERLAQFGAYPLLVVHDEIVVECPLGPEKDVAAALEGAMIDASPLCPMKVEAVVAYNSYAEGKT